MAGQSNLRAMNKTATLHRMVLPDHVCPYGVRSLELLKSKGFEVEDHQLKTRGEVDELEEELGVTTTPQTFIDGKRIGGYEDLVRYFGRQ